jgi:hypothetical protein
MFMKNKLTITSLIIVIFALVLGVYISDQDSNKETAYSAKSNAPSDHDEIMSVGDNIGVTQEGSNRFENKSLETTVSVKPAPERANNQVIAEPVLQEVPLIDNPDEDGKEEIVSDSVGKSIGEIKDPMTLELTASIEAYEAISAGKSKEGVFEPVPALPDGAFDEGYLETKEIGVFISVDVPIEDVLSDTKEIGVFIPADSGGI